MRTERPTGDDPAAGPATPPEAPPARPEDEPYGDGSAADDHREHHLHLPHPHLIDAEEDRFAWRAKIRRDPRKLFFYRIGVGLAGLLLMIGAILTGPLPGPGGIPLFLLGLAVWASEFEWAQSVMLWFKAQVDRYRGWSRGRRVGFWVAVIAFFWSMGYLVMVVNGVPGWVPQSAADYLRLLPGVD